MFYKMKNYKLFQICYILNFMFCLLLLGIILYRFIHNLNGDNPYLLLWSFVFITVLLIFDWLCYHLLKRIKTGLLVSSKKRIIGLTFNIISSISSIICFLGALTLISNIIEQGKSLYNFNEFIFVFSFLGLSITSIYLCIAYWILRKQLNPNFTRSNKS